MYSLLLFVCLIVGSTAVLAQAPTIPIVQGSYLLGGTKGGKWISAEETVRVLGEKVDFIRLNIDSPQKDRIAGTKGEKWDACHDETIIRFDEPTADEDDSARDETTRLSIGVNAKWDLMPRKPVLIASTDAAYTRVVKDFLRTKGITRSPIRISQVLEIDLDGDGKKEILISASYSRKQFDLSIGDYSFTILRTQVKGVMKNLLIDGQFLSKSLDFDLAMHYVVAVADLNGDGKMEIGLGVTYSESDTQSVYEFREGSYRKIFEVSCGG